MSETPAGERKYRCNFDGCTKTFNRRDYLERHAANHLQVKPYVCHPCKRQFSRKDLYENHLSTRFHSRRCSRENNAPQNASTQQNLQQQQQQQPQQQQLPPPQLKEEVPSLQPLPAMVPEDVYYQTHNAPIEFEMNATGTPTSELPNSLMSHSIRTDFEPNTFYNVMPGLESDRWDYYRPFKRLPAISDYGDKVSSPKRSLSQPGSTVSLSEGPESIASSEGSGGANSNDTVESGVTSMATSISSTENQNPKMPSRPLAPAPQGSAPAAAYKMWLIDRFQEGNDEIVKSLREPENADAEQFDKKYEWFFDDTPVATETGSYDYDRMYRDSFRLYKERSLKYQAANWPANAKQKAMPKTDEERTQLLIQIIASGSAEVIQSPHDIDQYIEAAWTKAQVVSCIVHRPTFNPNTAHPALMAVLVILGMALSTDEAAKVVAKSATPNVSLFVYESLEQAEGPMSTRFSPAYVGHFQAFCLLLKYEPIIIGRDLYASSLIRASSCRRSADKFISKMIASVSQLDLAPKDLKEVPLGRKPVWATISREGYAFHQGADQGTQWREWAAYEMCKRTVHFTVYYDAVISKCDSTHTGPPISLFNLDIQCPAPECIWHARDPKEFFYSVGPSGVLSNIPYLGLIKSLLRTGSRSVVTEENHAALSFFAFRMIAHGLMNITQRVTGVFGQGEQFMKAVLGQLQSDEKAVTLSPFFDQNIQARLYRGLDNWFQHFEQSFGQITQRLYKLTEAAGLRITNEIANDLNAESDERNIPQYALYLVLYHFSSFIVVHEDLPVALQVTTNLAKWLKQGDGLIEQPKLLEFLYMPLYVQWIQSDEAKAMVSTASLLLVWVDAATGQVETKSWNQLFLSAVIYTSVVVIWLFDLVAYYNAYGGSVANYSAGTVNIQNYDFIDQALQYLQYVREHPDGHHYKKGAQPPVLSVLLMGACILYNRPHTQELSKMLEQLICVLDPSLSADKVPLVLEGAADMFKSRHRLPASS